MNASVMQRHVVGSFSKIYQPSRTPNGKSPPHRVVVCVSATTFLHIQMQVSQCEQTRQTRATRVGYAMRGTGAMMSGNDINSIADVGGRTSV